MVLKGSGINLKHFQTNDNKEIAITLGSSNLSWAIKNEINFGSIQCTHIQHVDEKRTIKDLKSN